jgi:superoxide dismutase, Fe-Mn family
MTPQINALTRKPLDLNVDHIGDSFGCFDAVASRFVLPNLSFAKSALEPVTSASALGVHLNRHHAGYIAKANLILDGQARRYGSAPELVAHARANNETALFQQAAQALNHAFFWKCQHPVQPARPSGKLMEAIVQSFGGFDAMVEVACQTAVGRVGSGWLWLVIVANGRLAFEISLDSDTLLDHNAANVLMVCDVWEHAYYLDHKSDRAGWVEDYVSQLVDWTFVRNRFDVAAA